MHSVGSISLFAVELRIMDGNVYNEGKVILFDKPYQWSSFRAVKLIRKLTGAKKVGHAGTLDPLATGLLILCTGKFTKRINEFQGLPKIYSGSFVLGATTASYDLESEIEKGGETSHLTNQMVLDVAKSFEGEQLQIPPIFSAVKIDGVRAYKKARLGEEVVIQPKTVFIDYFEIVKIDMPEIHFKIKCSKGTYIRSLARDFGERLSCGAYMSALRRDAIGDFNVSDANTPEDWIEILQENTNI